MKENIKSGMRYTIYDIRQKYLQTLISIVFSYFRISLILSFVSCLLFLPTSIKAQTTGIEVTPASGEIVVTPGDSFSGTYVYRNNESSAIVGKISVGEIINGELFDDINKIDVEEWFKFDNTEVSILSGEQQEINFTVTVPLNVTMKTYEILILLNVTSDVSDSGESNLGQNLKVPYSIRLTINEESRYDGLVTVTKLDVKTPIVFDGNINIDVEMQNISGSITKPLGRFQVISLGGNQIFQEVINEQLDILNSKETKAQNISFKIDPSDIKILGQYKVQFLIIDTLTGISEIREANIFIISWPFVLAGLVIFSVIYTIVYISRKSLRKNKEKFSIETQMIK